VVLREIFVWNLVSYLTFLLVKVGLAGMCDGQGTYLFILGYQEGHSMKVLKNAGVIVIITIMLILPVQAFTADSLDVSVQDNGDADIRFGYTLNWIEHIAVYLRIADPAHELSNAFENNLHVPVRVEGVDSDSIRVMASKFATKTVNKEGRTTMSTPALSFREAEKVLQQYWFAPLISPDFSPAITTITYPDGYQEKFYNISTIPETTHTIP